ncbi:MAG: class I SAM-dependent methyltransferase [Oscillospiraceae bacterium]|nr:class I SAM-dependent methyltransferase [Oscillospiraceae bacterium]
MELSPRLAALAQWVEPGRRFADVGTDHGYLPVWLLVNGVLGRAVAADLRPGPLARAAQTARRYGVEGRLELRLCDGLEGLEPGEADTVAIAGMGGETIAGILERAPWTLRPDVTLLLQPMSAQPQLRQRLLEGGYTIAEERLACQGGTLYVAMRVRPGRDGPMTAAELWAGRQSRDPLRGRWLEQRLAKAEKALTGQRWAASPNGEEIARLEELAGALREMKREWDTWQQQWKSMNF